jgi:spore germination cell wall hydrolase CwlJ-like protein
LNEVFIRVLIILALLLCILLCMPRVAESALDAQRPTIMPTSMLTPRPAEPMPTPEPVEPRLIAVSHEIERIRSTPVLETPDPYTDEDKQIIAKVVYAEARGECFEGQVAVACVVINRYESGKYGSSIKNVAYAKHQFAVGKKYSDENMCAVEEAIKTRPLPDNTYYFSRGKRHYGEWYCKIGAHNFFVD